MTRAAGSVRFRSWIAPAIALALLTAGCAVTHVEAVTDAPDGTTIVKLTGYRPASPPPDPRTASPTVLQLQDSLRRIVVKLTRFSMTDPQPLLSEQQIGDYAQVLARELPMLSDTQRLRFKFKDRNYRKGSDVEFDVYREGTFLVYWFNALVSDAVNDPSMGGGPTFMAELEPAPGQIVANRDSFAYVKDPLLGGERAPTAEREAIQKQFEQARKNGDIEPEEESRLTAMMARPQPSAEAWKSYWERRHTLKAALQQGAMDRAAYIAQVERLNADMEKADK
jgi:hypothetical protein